MFWDFFSQVYKLPMLMLKRTMANPMGMFVYGILSKWYMFTLIATVTVTFWVFKGLEKAGVMDAMEKEVKYGFLQAQAVAQHCVPLIVDLPQMWDCIQHTTGDNYTPTADDEALKTGLENDLKNSNSPENANSPNAAPTSNSQNAFPGVNPPQNTTTNQPASLNPYDSDSPPPATSYDDGIIKTGQ